MKKLRVAFAGAAVVAVLSLPVAAWASHGKAGLWEITVRHDMGGMQGMPDMSQLPPAARAHMQAMSGQGMTVRHCMTPQEVASDKPVMAHQSDCKMTNVKMKGQSFSADMACTGRMQGTGHIEVTYDSPEHYAGMETMNIVAQGHPMSTTTHFNGRWISANCGDTH